MFLSTRRRINLLDKPVSDDLLHKLYNLMKWNPTGGNCTPAWLVFVRSLDPDGGPMPGFDKQKMDAEFFSDGNIR